MPRPAGNNYLCDMEIYGTGKQMPAPCSHRADALPHNALRTAMTYTNHKNRLNMYKTLLTLATVATLCFAACAQKPQNSNTPAPMKPTRTLVAYFSATGTTARVATEIANITGGDIFAITPKNLYSHADLDWNDPQSRSSKEMHNPQARPALAQSKDNMAAYDTIFIGYPIWWDAAPRIVNTFIESHDLAGKTIIPFATSGGSGIRNSVSQLKAAYPQLDWKEGKLLNHTQQEAIKEWIETL